MSRKNLKSELLMLYLGAWLSVMTSNYSLGAVVSMALLR